MGVGEHGIAARSQPRKGTVSSDGGQDVSGPGDAGDEPGVADSFQLVKVALMDVAMASNGGQDASGSGEAIDGSDIADYSQPHTRIETSTLPRLSLSC